MRKSIGFLFNHDGIHQVAHIAPIIRYLVRICPGCQVIAMVSSEAQRQRLFEILGPACIANVEIRKLEPAVCLRSLLGALNLFGPAQRLYILKRYKSVFAGLDCLVVPETTSTRLKKHSGLPETSLIFLPHGAGDRAIGYGEEIKYFDYVLLSGDKVSIRMLDAGLISAENYSIVGYPKFDTVDLEGKNKKVFFDNTNPTVLYNPHFDPLLSSWYSMGLDILEFFTTSPDYNLILAPHVMLFKKRLHVSLENRFFRFAKSIPSKYREYPNIKIDVGSRSSVNMDYTLNADIYLGDVSSQVYEFLYKPRPCIFLNSHRANWFSNPNYAHWHFGPVLEGIYDLSTVLDNAEKNQRHFYDIQARNFSTTFNLNETPSSLRAARSIATFLEAKHAAAA